MDLEEGSKKTRKSECGADGSGMRRCIAGDAWYFGKKHEKDTIGDPIREIEPRDILRSEKLMIGTEVLTFLLFGGIRLFF